MWSANNCESRPRTDFFIRATMLPLPAPFMTLSSSHVFTDSSIKGDMVCKVLSRGHMGIRSSLSACKECWEVVAAHAHCHWQFLTNGSRSIICRGFCGKTSSFAERPKNSYRRKRVDFPRDHFTQAPYACFSMGCLMEIRNSIIISVLLL